jgi:hypothetical protein
MKRWSFLEGVRCPRTKGRLQKWLDADDYLSDWEGNGLHDLIQNIFRYIDTKIIMFPKDKQYPIIGDILWNLEK